MKKKLRSIDQSHIIFPNIDALKGAKVNTNSSLINLLLKVSPSKDMCKNTQYRMMKYEMKDLKLKISWDNTMEGIKRQMKKGDKGRKNERSGRVRYDI